ncbi:restriction endonuclease, SacI family [Pseudomonas aeruginosa]|uniref:restriction endonuclease, SacI family n=1 Tax=Pseudomonas aeruginosa TaxID=287 RepID=UPI001C3EAA28|nr:restriction endonuclease, SacI family [Pseudomonas aeruginosa]MBV6121131.1 restriction endonuclease, SacI family [Pseudomonas aeruginosa]MBV6133374.1 restriction endonuclease, SacI family [Pseudomonas aeruginosa]
MNISKTVASSLVRSAFESVSAGQQGDAGWVAKIEHLSQLCQGQARTHIAFIGTEILAKSVSSDVDLYAIKPRHANGNASAYSARSLCHGVLVPLAAELGFNIGVTGREPLNNQPYFRMTRLDDGTPVHASSIDSFKYMKGLVDDLQQMTSVIEARAALQAYIAVRLRYQPRYSTSSGEVTVRPETLAAVIADFVRQDSEQGRRAQAVVAGLMDVVAGPERVESGRINDPSRNSPGDVCIRASSPEGEWEKAFEVRDKPVSFGDAQIFGKKCVDMGVREAAIVMVSDSQSLLSQAELDEWALGFGIGATLFHGWESLVEQALFWAGAPKPEAAIQAVSFIHERLIAIEASEDGVHTWHRLTRGS